MRNSIISGVSYLPFFSPADPVAVADEAAEQEAKKRQESAGDTGKPSTAAELAAFQQEQQRSTGSEREAIGANKPPVDTMFVPRAKNRAELLAEAAEASQEILAFDAKGETSIVSTISRVIADMLYLGLPSLGSNREELGVEGIPLGVRFLPDQAQPNLYDQLRSEATRVPDGMPEGMYFPMDVLESGTFRKYLNTACKKAVLLAYGKAEIGLVPAGLKGAGLYKATGVALEDMPQYDEAKYSQCVMVRANVAWPLIYLSRTLKSGERVVEVTKLNEDTSLIYLSAPVADALYALTIDNVGEAGVKRNDEGMLLGLAPAKRETGGTQNQTTTSTAANGAVAPTGEQGGPAIINSYQRLKSMFEDAAALQGGQSSVMGALTGIWNAMTKENADVDIAVFRTLAHMGRDAAYIVGDMFDPKNKNEAARLPDKHTAKAFADMADVARGHFKFRDGPDGKFVLFSHAIGSKDRKDWHEIEIDTVEVTQAAEIAANEALGEPKDEKQAEKPATAEQVIQPAAAK